MKLVKGLVALLFIILLIGCSSKSNKGTYYLYENGVKNSSSFLKISKNKWEDSDGLSGRVSIDNNQIVLYTTVFGSEEVLMEGEINDGVIIVELLNKRLIYAKDNALPELKDYYDITNKHEFEINNNEWSTKVDYTLSSIDINNIVKVSEGATIKVFKDSQYKVELKEKTNIPLNSIENTYYLQIIDPFYDVSVKEYKLKIIKDVPYTVNFWDADGNIIKTLTLKAGEYIKETPESQMTVPQGYSFESWYYLVGGIKTIVYSINNLDISNNMDFYPSFRPNQYHVSYKGDSEVDSFEMDISYDSEYFIYPPIGRQGYIFEGWMYLGELITDSNGSSLSNWQFTEDIQVVAKWSAISYKISLYLDGGSLSNNPGKITVRYGEPVTGLPVPEREGYVFAGWRVDSYHGSIPFDTNSYNYAEDMTIIATWQPESKIISFNTNGGSEIESMSVDYDSVVNNFPVPTRIGYRFVGWEYFGQLVNTLTVKSNITLKARWIANNYTIYLNDIDNKQYSVNVKFDSYIGDLIWPARTGYTFVGWFTEENGGIMYTRDTIYKHDGNINLYARYSINKWHIQFNSNGGNQIDDLEIDFGKEIDLSEVIASREGYTFVGWYNNKELTKPFDINQMPNNNITVYAKWQNNEYNIVFDYNMDDSSQYPSSKTVYYDKPVGELPVPQRLGYTFAGWYTSEQQGNVQYLGTMNYNVSDNLTLYAKWDVNTYEIVFNTNGGTQINKLEIKYLTTIPKLEESSRSGYTFVGWYIDEALEEEFSEEKMPANNIVLYAKWSALNYQIKFDYQGADENNVLENLDVTFDALVGQLPTPVKYEYSFVGWYTKQNGEGQLYKDDSVFDIVGDLILYAHYKSYQIEIIYDAKDKSVRENEDLSGSSIGAYAIDTDGERFDVSASIRLGKQIASSTISLTLSVEGKYGKTASTIVNDIKVYGTPNFTVSDIKHINEDSDFTINPLNIIAKDSFNNTLKTDYQVYEGSFTGGNQVTLRIKATDSAGNEGFVDIPGIRVYGKPTFVITDQVNAIKLDDTISDKLFKVEAYDSFGEKLEITVARRSYKITFDLKGGSGIQPSPQTVLHGNYASRPNIETNNLTKLDNHVFVGWYYKNKSGVETRFDFYKPITQDYDLYAKWQYTTLKPLFSNQNYSTYDTDYQGNYVFVAQTTGKYYIYANSKEYSNGNYYYFPIGTITVTSNGQQIYHYQSPGTGSSTGYQYPTYYYTIDVVEGQTYNVYLSARRPTTTVYVKVSANYQATPNPQYNTGIYDFVATAKDAYGNVGQYVFSDIKVLTKPAVTIGNNRYFDINTEINVSTLQIVAKDSIGNPINESNIIVTPHSSTPDKQPGKIMKYQVIVKDDAGNEYKTEINDIYIYGEPSFTYNEAKDAISTKNTLNASTFGIVAKDSFNTSLTPKITIVDGELKGGKYITVKFVVTDRVGNTKEVISQPMAVYDPNDLYMTYTLNSSDRVNINNGGVEFNAMATSTFGEAGVRIVIEGENGKSPVIGQVQNIRLVAIDKAGNRFVSDVIKDILVEG